MLAQFHCEVCKCGLGIHTEGMVCDKPECKKVSNLRRNLRSAIADYVEFFKGKTPSDAVYEEYLQKVGLEEKYKQAAGLVDIDSDPKFSRRVWFTTNISSAHSMWPDETGKLRNAVDA